MGNVRKKKKKHLKLSTIGGHTTVQFGNEWVLVTTRIPQKRLTERLTGSDLRHLKSLGIIQ